MSDFSVCILTHKLLTKANSLHWKKSWISTNWSEKGRWKSFAWAELGV